MITPSNDTIKTENSIDNLFEISKDILTPIINELKKFDDIDKFEIYVFGSIVKGGVRVTSDIDILVLNKYNEITNRKQMNELRYKMEEFLYNSGRTEREIDIKYYNKMDFLKSSENIGFENSISKYMIRII